MRKDYMKNHKDFTKNQTERNGGVLVEMRNRKKKILILAAATVATKVITKVVLKSSVPVSLGISINGESYFNNILFDDTSLMYPY